MSKFLYNNISFILINSRFLSLALSLYTGIHKTATFIEWNLGGGENNLTATLLFDHTSFIFLRVVLFISSNVVFYRKSYIREDFNADRFILLVFAFVVSIIIMIVSPNIIRILLGWDGLGLVSYCLVIYYPTKKSSRAGILTVIRNRVGDICILLRIGWFRIIGDYNFLIWRFWSEPIQRRLIIYLIIFAAITKRAQVPFSAWLPAAIAAPTPVSALVHSSTLVTAGVYLLIRFSDTLELRSKTFLLAVSTITIFISGLVANFEFDLKKIIALSTLRQLGIIIFAIAIGAYELAFFHLIIHALFKALLFLCAGTAIHRIGGSQDIRVYGGISKNFPIIGVCLNYANLSLCGMPFLAGFYSKDLIIEIAAQRVINQFILGVIFISVGLTVSYRLRLTVYTFVDFPNGNASRFICDQDRTIRIPIINLTFFSLLSGASLRWGNFLNPYCINLPFTLKIIALLIIMLGALLRYAFSLNRLIKKRQSIRILNFLGNLWFLPYNSGQILSFYLLKLGKATLKYNDQAWIEEASLNTLKTRSTNINAIFNWVQQNELKLHLLLFLVWLILVTLTLMYSIK
jgi:NADH-ubiquinone oxidoreductase chain 5